MPAGEFPPGIQGQQNAYTTTAAQSQNGINVSSQTEFLPEQNSPKFENVFLGQAVPTESEGQVQVLLEAESNKSSSLSCCFCDLRTCCIASGILIIAMGLCDLIQLDDMPKKYQLVTCGTKLLAGRTIDLGLDAINEKATWNNLLHRTNFTKNCEDLRNDAHVAIGLYVFFATSAGLCLLTAGIMKLPVIGVAGTLLLLLSIILFIAQTAVLYQLTPARQLYLFQDDEQGISTIPLPNSTSSTSAERNYSRKLWALGRAKEVISLLVVTTLYFYFGVCAISYYKQGRKPNYYAVADAVPHRYKQTAGDVSGDHSGDFSPSLLQQSQNQLLDTTNPYSYKTPSTGN